MKRVLEQFSLKGKKALIVCPENPFGQEIALGLADAGAEIWLAGNVEACANLPVAGRFAYDHGSAEAAVQLEKQVRDWLGVVDIVIENGLYTPAAGWTQSYETIYEQLKKTHLGMMLTVQCLGHLLKEQGHGSVLLVSDYGALVGYDPENYQNSPERKMMDFSYLKGFIVGGAVNYVRQASNYLAENGCRCNALAFSPLEGSCPDGFAQAFIRHSQIKRLLTPADVAAAAVFLASDASSFITGVTLPVDGGYTAK